MCPFCRQCAPSELCALSELCARLCRQGPLSEPCALSDPCTRLCRQGPGPLSDPCTPSVGSVVSLTRVPPLSAVSAAGQARGGGPAAADPAAMDGLVMPPPAGLPLLPRQRAYTHTHARLQSGFSSQRAAFGPVAMRSSCSERLHPRHRSRAAAASSGAATAGLAAHSRRAALYRSNSSLELEPAAGSGGLRREFGSHGSIDAIGGDAAFAVLTEFRSLDPELAAAREAAHDADEADAADASPRLRSRLQRLWDRDRRGSRKAGSGEQSLFRKLRGSVKEPPRLAEPETTRSSDSLDGEARQEERRRRRALVHYDCQSLRVSLAAVARRRSQLEERHNRATGASAASKPTWRAPDDPTAPASTPAASADEMSEDEDRGDDRSNELVQR